MTPVPRVNIHEHLQFIHLFAIFFYQNIVALNGNTL